jgi:arginyl-tRNA--protein-N-Asp/Glu arginylyltransferase
MMDAIGLSQLEFYLTPEHECSYLPDQQAMTLFADPHREIGTELYSKLIEFGFRRSGKLVYRPRCPLCDACIPLRLPVQQFRASRSQRRNLARNADIDLQIRPATCSDEHFNLYLNYIRSRHTGGGMDNDDPHRYRDFLLNPHLDVQFHEFRIDGQLIAVAVTDHLDNALSAVYTYFDPGMANRGLGIYAILSQIQTARELNMQYLYLGYWIAESEKMAYKSNFRPYETFRDGRWQASNAL